MILLTETRNAGYMRDRKIQKRIGLIVLFGIGFYIINRIMSFLLVPNVSYFRQTAYDATSQKDIYDVVCVGSSEEWYCFNSPMATQMLNRECFNMGSAGSSVADGMYSSFRLFMKNQKPSLVMIMLNTVSLSTDENDAAYAGIAQHTRDALVNSEYFFRSLLRPGFVHRLFPWSAYHIDTLDELVENIQVKTSKEYRNHDAGLLPSESCVYKGRGYCPQLPGDDNSNVISYAEVNLDWDNVQNAVTDDKAEYDERHEKALVKMIKQARESGAEVLITMAPMTKTYMVSSGTYADGSEQLRELAEANGASFVDLNYAKPDLYDPKPDEYVDDYHVLMEGSDRYTRALCDYITMCEKGEDTSSLFYSNLEELVESYDWSVYKGLN